MGLEVAIAWSLWSKLPALHSTTTEAFGANFQLCIPQPLPTLLSHMETFGQEEMFEEPPILEERPGFTLACRIWRKGWLADSIWRFQDAIHETGAEEEAMLTVSELVDILEENLKEDMWSNANGHDFLLEVMMPRRWFFFPGVRVWGG